MIVAVDFDGILCEDRFPCIGKPNYEMVSFVRQLIDAGHEVVLWTCRVEDRLEEALAWCEDRGLHFCAVNENAPSNLEQYGTNSRKVYADVYLEDRCPWFFEHDMYSRRYTAPYDAVETTIDKARRMLAVKTGGEDD